MNHKPNKFHLPLIFAGIVFLILLATIIITGGIIFLLDLAGISLFHEQNKFPLFLLAIVSLVIGTIIALVFSRRPLSPIRKLSQAADKVAAGDFSTRISLKGPPELTKLSEHFNNMAAELENVEMLRNDFISDFSHEFKTPIVSIRGFAKMLKNPELSEQERQEYLDIIISESERLSGLSNSILSLSKLEKQGILTGKEHVNISEQIRLCAAQILEKWSERNLEIDFECGERYVMGSAELLSRVWLNLLDNAAKFSPEGGIVTIKILMKERSLEVIIEDDGPGISSSALKHVFEKFYQEDRSRTVQGAGLGLSIVKRIAELHGGSVEIESEEGKGAKVRVALPVENAFA